ncbi:MAG: MBL fold metallo-hydrolase [Patescibacteria group bacterium]
MEKWRWYVAGVLFGLAFANWAAWEYVLDGRFLKVTFFDVGQGDAIFIETSQGHQILIDGGPSKKVVEKVGKTLPFWDKSIDLVILTHPDADHITGLVSVLEQYNVENVLWTGVEANTNIFRSWEQALEKSLKPDFEREKVGLYLARAPQKLVWSQNPSYEFMEILYPDNSAISSAKAVNDTSLVSKLVFGSDSFLFPGDISKTAEQKLVDQKADIAADVLKVPHHGSKSSSSESFLAAVSPNIAVIQVGAKNRYGHPTKEVLARLGNISVLRTDEKGDIVVKITATHFSIQTER